MIKSILYVAFYIISELMVFDFEAQKELFNYYFNIFGDFSFVYFPVFIALVIFLFNDFIDMIKESFLFLKEVFIYKKSLITAYKNYTKFNILIVWILLSLVTFLFYKLSIRVYTLFFICIMLLITAFILRLSLYFKNIRLDSKLITFKDFFILGIFQVLSFIPGISRTVMFLGLGGIFGLNKIYLVKITFLSLLPVLFLKMSLPTFYNFNDILTFFIMVLFSLILIFIVYRLLTRHRFHKNYLYLMGIAIWTMLDLFFNNKI